MEISMGLFAHMVLQRTRRNVSAALFAGECSATGSVVARVTRQGQVVRGFEGRKLGLAGGGRFKGTLAGLPAGGPYSIALTISNNGGQVLEQTTIADVLVGDVWILGGRSNMQGRGNMDGAEKPAPRVRAFFMNDQWRVARDPLHQLWQAVDPVHAKLNGGPIVPPTAIIKGVGPGVAFGKEMLRLTGVPQGMLACAHGGTSMSQWDPKLKNEGGASLYGATLRRVRKNGGKAAGIVWYQGESDTNPQAAALYTKRMKELMRCFRRDLNIPSLPIALVQLARTLNGSQPRFETWNSIQEQQRILPSLLGACTTVPAIDLALDDSIHISGKAHARLGRRLAQAMFVTIAGRKGGLPPIGLKKVSVVLNKLTGSADVLVKFEHVAGALRADGLASGFTLTDGQAAGLIFDTEVAKNTVRLRTCLAMHEAESTKLHYGLGLWPHCNIYDAGDRSLPVFGPLHLGRPALQTNFATTLRVSKLLPSAGKLHRLAYPANKASLGLEKRAFAGNFCGRHLELEQHGADDPLVYYLCEIECPEPMKLAVNLGYDGPVKLWLDRKERFFDPHGATPALAGAKAINFDSCGGKHEVLVALGSNQGRAWGIFLRFERRVPVAALRKNPEKFSLPKILG